jgi:hypothetical protein
MSIGSVILPFILNWLVLFVACYIVTEYAQYYLYDEATPGVGWKSALAAAILAAVLTWTRTSYDTMLTSELGKTVIQAIVWFAVFTLVLRFHPWHALGLGVVTMLLIAGLATLAVDSFERTTDRRPVPERRPSQPFRQPLSPATGPPTVTPPKEKAAPVP